MSPSLSSGSRRTAEGSRLSSAETVSVAYASDVGESYPPRRNKVIQNKDPRQYIAD